MPRATNRKYVAGWQTSEFWLSVIVLLAATFLAYSGRIDAELWGIAVGIQGGAYTISRGLVKKSA